MTRDSTQTGITFDVDGHYETLGEEREVDTEATGEVHEDTVNTTAVASGHNGLLVACRLLAGTLLHIQVRRIDDAGVSAHDGSLYRAVCHPFIWSRASGTSTSGSYRQRKQDYAHHRCGAAG